MRIIAGSKRRMKLLSPKGLSSRSITDRVKESLFSVLYKYELPQGKIVADLFCGVGSLGLEALSREAAFVSFVEQDPKVVSVLDRNIKKAGFVKESKVIRADAFKIGAPFGSDEERCELVFVDPPYALTEDTNADSPLSKLLGLLSEQVSQNGIVVVRVRRNTELAEQYGRLRTMERRQWGTMAVAIFRRISE